MKPPWMSCEDNRRGKRSEATPSAAKQGKANEDEHRHAETSKDTQTRDKIRRDTTCQDTRREEFWTIQEWTGRTKGERQGKDMKQSDTDKGCRVKYSEMESG